MTTTFKYISIKKFAELGCYSEEAVRAKIKKNQWVEGTHHIKTPDGKRMLNLVEVEKWIESMKG